MGDEESEWLSFPHKMIHEYIAACYLVREIEKSNEILKLLFPKWKDIKIHEEVYNFCIGCSDSAEQASLLISHFCAVLSEKMIENVKPGSDKLCHSGIYKMDTIPDRVGEMEGYSDTKELTQVFSGIRREASGHKDTCTNPVCNEYIHLYPDCGNIDPNHISKCNLIIFNESITSDQHLLGAVNNVPDQHKKGKQSLVIFGDNDSDHDLTSINYAMSCCNVIQVYMRGCRVENSVNSENVQSVNNIFTPSLETLCMQHCTLPGAFWDRIGSGLAGSEAIERVLLADCTGITELLVNCIGSCTAPIRLELERCELPSVPSLASSINLTKLKLRYCKLSHEACGTLCMQLIHLTHLNQIKLSDSPVGEHVKLITAAISAWGPSAVLRDLDLSDCELPAEQVPALLSALTECCPLLNNLCIDGNRISGCLSSFMAAVPAYLANLGLRSCQLQLEDVASITTALLHNRLPQLMYLNIRANSLSDNVVEPLLQAANTHHQGRLEVDLRYNTLSAEFTSRWSSQTRPQLHLSLHPQKTQLAD